VDRPRRAEQQTGLKTELPRDRCLRGDRSHAEHVALPQPLEMDANGYIITHDGAKTR